MERSPAETYRVGTVCIHIPYSKHESLPIGEEHHLPQNLEKLGKGERRRDFRLSVWKRENFLRRRMEKRAPSQRLKCRKRPSSVSNIATYSNRGKQGLKRRLRIIRNQSGTRDGQQHLYIHLRRQCTPLLASRSVHGFLRRRPSKETQTGKKQRYFRRKRRANFLRRWDHFSGLYRSAIGRERHTGSL